MPGAEFAVRFAQAAVHHTILSDVKDEYFSHHQPHKIYAGFAHRFSFGRIPTF